MDLNFSECYDETLETQIESQNEVYSQKKTRSVNYSHYEDLALTRAWLNISEDNIVGIGQKSPRLWGRILAQFHQILGHQSNRNIQSLANRWLNISHDVSKFYGHYNKVGRLNPSGWNDQMKILKDTSKWNAYLLERNQSKQPKKTTKPTEQTTCVNNLNHPTSTLATPIPLDEDVSPIITANLMRPKGRRKAKAKSKKEGTDEDANVILKSINETLKEAAEIEKEKYKAKKKRTELKVMSQSMVGLTHEQQSYFKLQQSMTMQHYKEDGLMSDLEAQNPFGFNFNLNED
ncbi:hypothetical protein Dsin_002241 [Dipteronia sinensis]|uniref:No apical meristem-associated C-terminal domain-containing protein n=1 Tax=Dipteronia sinensis TaxID=43782 RepID=A0AAE0B6U4_9ROSI|nr:hypothetical protein Dsin_002241 [Dipteronia sinensis]